MAVGVVVVGKRRRGLFIGVEGGGEEGTRRWPAGGLGGAPLMAFGGYRGVMEQRRGRRGGHRTTGRLGQARVAPRAFGVHREARGRGAERVRRVFRARGAHARVYAWSR